MREVTCPGSSPAPAPPGRGSCGRTPAATASGSWPRPATPSSSRGPTRAWTTSPGAPGSASPPSTGASPSARRSCGRSRSTSCAAPAASAARAEEPDAFGALARYLHRALDLRVSAAMPVLVGELQMDEELLAARRASAGPLDQIIRTARAEGSLRPDVASGDVGLLLVRLARPLPGPFPPAVNHRLAHRHLDLLLDGLRSPAASGAPLPGPAMTFEDLAAMPQRPGPTDVGSSTPHRTPDRKEAAR